eukprot:8584981-Pyramimonas_sp.AAC.1
MCSTSRLHHAGVATLFHSCTLWTTHLLCGPRTPSDCHMEGNAKGAGAKTAQLVKGCNAKTAQLVKGCNAKTAQLVK